MAQAPRRFALIAAAGGGSRFGASEPKQYALLAGVPIVARSIAALAGSLSLDAVFVVVAPDDARFATAVAATAGAIALHCGGATRADSVANALAAMADRVAADDWVLVHDAARPCVDAAALSRLVSEVGDDPVGGLLAMPLSETLKRAESETDARVTRTEDRRDLWCAQTPQMFRYALLRRALENARGSAITDDAQAIESLGLRPRLVKGSVANIKITFAEDLALAEAVLAQRGEKR
jgi:2-C-methyl-D-erythritol 4-phosphate cytidylyltransferase